MNEHVFNIDNHVNDGFEKVCEVVSNYGHWRYKKINENLMFSTHRSWVYFIVVNKTIVKVGETGNPLGIEEVYLYGDYELQPAANSKSRLGRYRKGDGTDSYVRENLRPVMEKGVEVSIWAKPCDVALVTTIINSTAYTIKNSVHKDLEIAYLNYFVQHGGRLPLLNKAKK